VLLLFTVHRIVIIIKNPLPIIERFRGQLYETKVRSVTDSGFHNEDSDSLWDAIENICGRKYGRNAGIEEETVKVFRLLSVNDARAILKEKGDADGIQSSVFAFNTALQNKIEYLTTGIAGGPVSFDDYRDYNNDDINMYGSFQELEEEHERKRKRAKTSSSSILRELKAGALSTRDMSLPDRITRLERALASGQTKNNHHLEDLLELARKTNDIVTGKYSSPHKQVIDMLRELVASASASAATAAPASAPASAPAAPASASAPASAAPASAASAPAANEKGDGTTEEGAEGGKKHVKKGEKKDLAILIIHEVM
jgi:hypothetical protein